MSNQKLSSEGNFNLLSISATIFSVFFGVWWGIVTTYIFSLQQARVQWCSLDCLRWGYIFVSLLYAGLFTGSLSRWLWHLARVLNARESLGHFFRSEAKIILKQFVILTSMTLLSGVAMRYIFRLDLILAMLGGLLLITWCGVSIYLLIWKMADDDRVFEGQNWEDNR